jgi:hypothetical protein
MRFSLLALPLTLLLTTTLSAPTMRSRLTAEDIVNIRDAISEYAFIVDRQTLNDLSNVFTSDVQYALPGATLNGLTAVKNAFGPVLAGKRSQHAMSSVVVDSSAANAAVSQSYFTATFFGAEPQAGVAHGVYDDSWVKDGMRWLIKKRTLTYLVCCFALSTYAVEGMSLR